MSEVVDFFKAYKQTCVSLNVKLTVKGQVQYFTGTLDPGLGNHMYSDDRELFLKSIEKDWRKRIASSDYRFANTELSVTGKQFSITKTN